MSEQIVDKRESPDQSSEILRVLDKEKKKTEEEKNKKFCPAWTQFFLFSTAAIETIDIKKKT